MKKLLLTSALVAGFAGTALAHPHPTVTLGGNLDTQFGHVSQKSGFGGTGVDKRHKHAIVNDTTLHVKVDGKAGNGLKYGGLVELAADTSKDKFGNEQKSNKTMAYVETMFGRMEAGSTEGVVNSMSVGGADVARATGGIDGDAQYWWDQDHGAKFLVKAKLPSNYNTNKDANAAKLNFMSPSFMGFKAGLTFIPDMEQKGSVNGFHTVKKGKVTTDGDFAYKNVFSGGLHYTGKMDKVGFKAALLGETGDAKDTTADAKRHDLKAWELGGSVNLSGMTFGASYGSHGKSGVEKVGATGKTRSSYWTVGAGYEYGAMGASVTYMESKKGGKTHVKANEASNLSVGLDYKLAPGFMPYAEVSFFEQKERSAASGNAKNDGTIFLAGTKLSF